MILDSLQKTRSESLKGGGGGQKKWVKTPILAQIESFDKKIAVFAGAPLQV